MRERDAMSINGRLAARWARRTVERLRRERNDINAINVFPVADGDTGTNLYHTVRSAYRAVESLRGPVSLGEVVSAMATGALRGARGNSGLILSVALQGVADALDGVSELDAPTFAGALELAAARARGAVAAPVDGTMLTVLQEMAAEARRQADAGAELVTLIAAVRETSRRALRETTGQLQVLSDNDVVDAGSTGIVELFDLLYLTVVGEEIPEPEAPAGFASNGSASAGSGPGGSALAGSPAVGARPSGAAPAGSRAVRGGPHGTPMHDSAPGVQARASDPARTSGTAGSPHPGAGAGESLLQHTGEQGFELVFHLQAGKDRARRVKKALTALGGTSLVISWPLIHVHVPDEDTARAALRAVEGYGITQLRVEDLSVRGGRSAASTVIAFAAGTGLLFACGLQDAHVVSSDSPSAVETALELIRSSETPVILVPDSARLLTELRQRTRELTDAEAPITLIRSRSPVAALSALAVYDASAAAVEIAEDMAESAAATRTAGVVRAAHGSAGPLIYQAGALLTIIDGRIRSVETDPAEAVIACAERLLGAGGELMTIVTGAQLPAAAAAALLRYVETRHPLVSVDIVDSEHPAGCAVLGVE